MAQNTQESARALIARLDAARAVLGNEVRIVRKKLDIPARIRESVLTRPVAWLGSSAGAGVVASFLLKRSFRPKKEEKKRGVAGFLLGSAFALARPALQAWGMRELRKRVDPSGRMFPGQE